MRLKQFARYVWGRFATLSFGVAAIAAVVALSWVWGSVSMIQTNFDAQKVVDERQHELEVLQLEVATLQYQQNYYQSDEYKDLEARAKLGLVSPDEKVLILPDNSQAVQQQDAADNQSSVSVATQNSSSTKSNFQQWIDFLSGKSASQLQNQ